MAKTMQLRGTAPIWGEGDNQGAFRRYMNDVLALPRPTHEQSTALAVAVMDARYALWRTILADPALVCAAMPMLRTAPPGDTRRARVVAELARKNVVDGLERRALRAAAHPSSRSSGAYARKAALVLEAFAWADADGVLSDAICAELGTPLLQQKTAACRAAKDRATRANLRLVIAVASRVSRVGAIQLQDLVSEGNIGLMKAVCRFDPRKGVKFSTYAVWWIRHTVRRAVCDQGRLVRLPVHVVDRLYKVFATQATLATRLGRPPDDDEVATACGVGLDKVRQLLRAGFWPLSLDGPCATDDAGEPLPLGSLIPDAAPPPDVLLETDDRVELARALLREIDGRRADILRARFGFNGERRTLEEIAQTMDLSRERVRQLECYGLDDLRGIAVARVRRRRRAALGVAP